jgi:hypothetical protein
MLDSNRSSGVTWVDKISQSHPTVSKGYSKLTSRQQSLNVSMFSLK